MITFVIGADHRGFHIKEQLKKHTMLGSLAVQWIDVGAHDAQRSDYPLFVEKACQELLSKKADKGILLCGSGVGMSIAANRFAGIYAALVWNKEVSVQSKQDDNANVLVLPADYITESQALEMITAWLQAEFKGGRYQERISMIDEMCG